MKTPKIHYAGAVRTPWMMILPGWSACCSGEKAERIRAAGNNSTDPDNVTCAACKRVMAKDTMIIFNAQHEDPCVCKHCGNAACTFHHPICAEALYEHEQARRHGMPPSGRHA